MHTFKEAQEMIQKSGADPAKILLSDDTFKGLQFTLGLMNLAKSLRINQPEKNKTIE
jgi:hypothetical protein